MLGASHHVVVRQVVADYLLDVCFHQLATYCSIVVLYSTTYRKYKSRIYEKYKSEIILRRFLIGLPYEILEKEIYFTFKIKGPVS